jgi:hypothetical protein
MFVGYMGVSTDRDRQVLDLQRDALQAAGVDERHLFEDRVSGNRGDRASLAGALEFLRPVAAWWSGSWTGWADRYRTCSPRSPTSRRAGSPSVR